MHLGHPATSRVFINVITVRPARSVATPGLQIQDGSWPLFASAKPQAGRKHSAGLAEHLRLISATEPFVVAIIPYTRRPSLSPRGSNAYGENP